MSLHRDSLTIWTGVLARRVCADRETVFNLLAEVELWPALFPRIRSARVLRRNRRRRLIVVKASWRGLPIGYAAMQIVDAERGQITIRHLSRLTRGSVATWTVQLTPEHLGVPAGCVDLKVQQQLVVPVPLVGGILAHRFVGGRVARDLDQAMLDRVKEVAEGGSLAARR